ncbi:MAG: thioredoxin fold domain-containing protein [bacterium]|nr:thioredoxin fold domain-containing protein [bacterium]
MKHRAVLSAAIIIMSAVVAVAQGFEVEPVFRAQLEADRTPLVAGESVRLATVVEIEHGWHINSNEPGDDFSVPTELEWRLPEGWQTPIVSFPAGHPLKFEFSEDPINVWEGNAVIVGMASVPVEVSGEVELVVAVTAQACNNSQCLPPMTVLARGQFEVAPHGSTSKAINDSLFRATVQTQDSDQGSGGELEGLSLPLLLIAVFLAGLALNLTPCVFPLIPITIGFFSQQTQDRKGSSFWLALAYVLGLAMTYSTLGLIAALTGQLFGAALQSPWVVGLIVAVLLALATSMFGLWELRVPGWAQRASGGRGGVFGALMMGLIMGFVAAPCIGPFVLGLLTYVGQRGDPVLGFVLFFTLAIGLGVPYLLLGTFTGLMQRLPASGMWMIGVRRVFGVILIAMAAYFAAPLLSAGLGDWLIGGVLVLGSLYLLVIDRTGHEQPAIDRVMRLVLAGTLVVGLSFIPMGRGDVVTVGEDGGAGHLQWETFDEDAAKAAVEAGGPVILDFYADWCAPCRELDEKTFSDPSVSEVLEGYTRYKVDLTSSNAENSRLVQEYTVRGVPTVIVYDGGSEKFRITGFEPPAQFLKRLQ